MDLFKSVLRLSVIAPLMLLSVLAGCGQGNVRSEGSDASDLYAGAAAETPSSEAASISAGNDSEDGRTTSEDVVVGQPDWKVGDRWLWSDGYGLEVVSREGETTLLERTDAKDQWQRREGLFLVESRDKNTHRRVVFRSERPERLFPLKLGNQVVFKREYLANGQLKVHRTSWVVEGRELIEVPAGEFDCWVLTRRTRSLRSDWTGYERLWFSPEAKHHVRMEYRYGRGEPSSRVLMTYRLMP